MLIDVENDWLKLKE